jgi:hypothetical protein
MSKVRGSNVQVLDMWRVHMVSDMVCRDGMALLPRWWDGGRTKRSTRETHLDGGRS